LAFLIGDNGDYVSRLVIMTIVASKLFPAIFNKLERLWKYSLDFIDSKGAAGHIVQRVVRIDYGHWLKTLWACHKALVNNRCIGRIEIVSIEIQYLLQVFADFPTTVFVQECRSHKDQAVRI